MVGLDPLLASGFQASGKNANITAIREHREKSGFVHERSLVDWVFIGWVFMGQV